MILNYALILLNKTQDSQAWYKAHKSTNCHVICQLSAINNDCLKRFCVRACMRAQQQSTSHALNNANGIFRLIFTETLCTWLALMPHWLSGPETLASSGEMRQAEHLENKLTLHPFGIRDGRTSCVNPSFSHRFLRGDLWFCPITVTLCWYTVKM